MRYDKRPPLPVDKAKAVPILEVARRLGLGEPVPQGREWVVLCPVHDDHHPSCRLNEAKNVWFCDVCQVGNDSIDLVMRARNISFSAAVLWLVRGV
jgi:DNA primase